jgi:hypothetical protein
MHWGKVQKEGALFRRRMCGENEGNGKPLRKFKEKTLMKAELNIGESRKAYERTLENKRCI